MPSKMLEGALKNVFLNDRRGIKNKFLREKEYGHHADDLSVCVLSPCSNDLTESFKNSQNFDIYLTFNHLYCEI